MLLTRSATTRPLSGRSLARELDTIEPGFLEETVEALAVPRHFLEEPAQNRKTRDWISDLLASFGSGVSYQSACDNVIAQNTCDPTLPKLLIGAHYDSVPGSPGADDNASALAALLSVARALARLDLQLPIVFVAFNREEESLLGSRLFSKHLRRDAPFTVREAHILEMTGFTDTTASSQRKPRGLPIRLPESGDFLGLVAKGRANHLIKPMLGAARAYVPEMPVLGLQVWLGLDRCFKVLRRSDHSPLWDVGTPAIMWTDTAEFRNPNYHRASDTPDTLDFRFLTNVSKLLLAHVLLTLDPQGERQDSWTTRATPAATK